MKVAQIAPLIESVPPTLYGGTERIVSYLTEELVRQGHEVVLFATGDSRTEAELVACHDRALRLAGVADPLPWHVLQLERLRRRADEFDILHFHCDYLHFPLARCLNRPTVTTMHGRLDLPDYPALFAEFADMPLVSISDSQRRPLPLANWVATVLHGFPAAPYRPTPGAHKGWLAFLGRICPDKGPDRAIEIARRAGVPLKIAAKVDRVDKPWFDEVIRPMLDDPLIEFLGELDDAGKRKLLSGSRALLFPIDWPEPFGLAMIEAMACGTPVIAFRRGSVPEVIDHGRSGLIVDSVDEAVEAVARIGEMDRRLVRDCFDQRFSVERMTRDYLRVYETVVDAWTATRQIAARPLQPAVETLLLHGSNRNLPGQAPLAEEGVGR